MRQQPGSMLNIIEQRCWEDFTTSVERPRKEGTGQHQDQAIGKGKISGMTPSYIPPSRCSIVAGSHPRHDLSSEIVDLRIELQVYNPRIYSLCGVYLYPFCLVLAAVDR
jgi:hypothetical protein